MANPKTPKSTDALDLVKGTTLQTLAGMGITRTEMYDLILHEVEGELEAKCGELQKVHKAAEAAFAAEVDARQADLEKAYSGTTRFEVEVSYTKKGTLRIIKGYYNRNDDPVTLEVTLPDSPQFEGIHAARKAIVEAEAAWRGACDDLREFRSKTKTFKLTLLKRMLAETPEGAKTLDALSSMKETLMKSLKK